MDVWLRAVSEEEKGGVWTGAERGDSIGFSRKFDPNDPCTYSTIRKYKCFLQEDDATGSPVQNCEKTEQLLRRCPGRPVEVVESQTEYTEGDAASGSTSFWSKNEDRPFLLPRHPSDLERPQSIFPRPSIEPDWPRGCRWRDESGNLPTSPVPPAFPGFRGMMGAFEDLVKETENMAHNFFHVLGLDGDETNATGNPFDRWLGGDIFGGQDRRTPERQETSTSNGPAQSSSKPDSDPEDFREV